MLQAPAAPARGQGTQASSDARSSRRDASLQGHLDSTSHPIPVSARLLVAEKRRPAVRRAEVPLQAFAARPPPQPRQPSPHCPLQASLNTPQATSRTIRGGPPLCDLGPALDMWCLLPPSWVQIGSGEMVRPRCPPSAHGRAGKPAGHGTVLTSEHPPTHSPAYCEFVSHSMQGGYSFSSLVQRACPKQYCSNM